MPDGLIAPEQIVVDWCGIDDLCRWPVTEVRVLDNLGGPSQRWVRSESLITAMMDGETLMLDSHSGMYYGIDAVGTRIWEYLASPITIPDLVERLEEQYEVETQRCARDVADLIEQLAARKMIKTANA